MKRLNRSELFVTLTLIRKEFLNYFSSPFAYIILGLFVSIISILFFGLYKFTLLGTADLKYLFTSIAFSFIIIIPALMMGTISKEKQTGTIEYILTQPLTEVNLLIAKFINASFMVFFMLLTTLPIVILVSRYAPLDVGQLFMQYTGSFLLGLCFITIGLAVSGIFKNEITSLIVSLIVSSLFILAGTTIIRFLPFELDFFTERISLLSHFESMSKGVLDIRDVLYFFAFIFTFFIIAYYFLVKDKYPKNNRGLKKIILITVATIVISVSIGVVGQIIPGRIDFTANGIYTLSDETKNVIKNIDGTVDITLYISSNLPVQFQANARTVEDLLKDYKTKGGGRINFQIKNPDRNEDAAKEATEKGLQELVFAVNSSDSAQQTVGYFGINIGYKDKNEVIAYIDDENAVEFDVTRKIKKLTSDEKQIIGVVTNAMSKTFDYDYQTFNAILSELYEVKNITLDEENPSIPEDVKILVLPGPREDLGETVTKNIRDYFANGGAVLFLANPVLTDLYTTTPEENEFSLADLFETYGVKVNSDLVYDLKNNNIINVGSDYNPVAGRYPLWFSAKSTNENISILKEIDSVSILWGSSLFIDENKTQEAKISELLETSDLSNVQVYPDYNTAVEQTFELKADDSSRIVAASIENSKSGRAVVVGNVEFLSDSPNMVMQEQNLAFGLACVEWLLNDEGLSAISAKNRTAPKLNLTDDESTVLVSSSVGIPLVVILLSGTIKFVLRRREMNKTYAK